VTASSASIEQIAKAVERELGLALPARTGALDREAPEPKPWVLCPGPPIVLDRFAFDSAAPTARHRVIIGEIARRILDSKATPDPVLVVCNVGHTDPSGNALYNEKLGLRRAKAVEAALSAALAALRPGQPASSWFVPMQTFSEGANRPKVGPAGDQALNRRVEVYLKRTPPPPRPSGQIPKHLPARMAVATAQRCLSNILGVALRTDGIVGPNTRAAVRSFQSRRGLTPNGLLTSATLNALLSICRARRR
jgi:hypothetical protein